MNAQRLMFWIGVRWGGVNGEKHTMCEAAMLGKGALLSILLVLPIACDSRKKAPSPAAQASAAQATAPSATQSAAAAADNSYCYVCHVNYQTELLTEKHQEKGIGCAGCHGESEKHSSDENGITPPDIMVARENQNVSCVKCHATEKLAATKDNPHKDLIASPASAKHVCTECHGSHRLAVRTRRWDRVTGKLIADDGVRMVQDK